MLQRIAGLTLVLLTVATLAMGATLEEARRLYRDGDPEAARQALTEILAGADDAEQAAALKLLGQIEVDAKRWAGALEAWGELADRHAGSAEAASIAAALRPLQALADCGCAGPDQPDAQVAASQQEATPEAAPEATRAEPVPPTPAPVPMPAPAAPTAESAPAPTPGSAAGLLLVGGWSKSFESSQEATQAMVDFLDEAGVAVRFVPTDVAAARGAEVTLSFLLDQAEESGALGVLFFSARFSHRDYVLAERFDPRGTLLWKEKIQGGTELRASRDRGKVRWALVERMQKRLSKRIGTPDLPTQ